MQIPVVGGAYLSRSSNASADRCVNLYPEVVESQMGKVVSALYGTPGTRLLVALGGSGGIRGAHVPAVGDAIVVRGSTVYRVTTGWVATSVGTIDSLTTPVSIADNGSVAVIVTGPRGYVLDLTSNTLSQIADPDFYGADVVWYLDNYFVFNRPDTEQFYISSLGGTDFDALDFASAEGAPDLLVSLIADHRELWLFGATSTEVFTNTGNTDFPFQRDGNIFIEQGCAAKFSPSKIDNTVFWLGKDENGQGVVWRAQGFTPARISTHAVEFAIQNYSDISDAIGYTYQQEGHSFYMLTFPTANKTWCYDVATGLWHERAYRDSNNDLNRHRSNCHMFFGGEHVVGDWENGNLYALDLDYYSDNGDTMPAIRVCPHVSNPDELWMFWDALQVIIESGVGLQAGQGSDPQIALDYSDDGGHTWSNERWADMGAVGGYKVRARWTRLGRSRDRILRLTITDPVKRVILSGTAKIRLGRS